MEHSELNRSTDVIVRRRNRFLQTAAGPRSLKVNRATDILAVASAIIPNGWAAQFNLKTFLSCAGDRSAACFVPPWRAITVVMIVIPRNRSCVMMSAEPRNELSSHSYNSDSHHPVVGSQCLDKSARVESEQSDYHRNPTKDPKQRYQRSSSVFSSYCRRGFADFRHFMDRGKNRRVREDDDIEQLAAVNEQ